MVYLEDGLVLSEMKSNFFSYISHRFKRLIQNVHKLWNDHACMLGIFLLLEVYLKNVLDQ